MIQQFIKKPLPICAVKCIKENEDDIKGLLRSGVTEWEPVIENGEMVGVYVHSWEGIDPVYYDYSRNVNSGNKPYWIMRGLKGECYPCVSDDEEDSPLGYYEVK